MEGPQLVPSLSPLAELLGVWEGEGAGDYPTIDPFRYREQVSFGHVGKPFLAYQQRTWHRDTGLPMHAEVGYLRLGPPAEAPSDAASAATSTATSTAAGEPHRVELVLAHPTGITEVEEGTLAEGILELETTHVGRTASAKEVRSLRRRFDWRDGVLVYDLWMAHAQTPETHHLHAELHRQDP